MNHPSALKRKTLREIRWTDKEIALSLSVGALRG
jgi:hypothetical protein